MMASFADFALPAEKMKIWEKRKEVLYAYL